MNRRLLKGKGNVSQVVDQPLDRQLAASDADILVDDMMRCWPRFGAMIWVPDSHHQALMVSLAELTCDAK